MKFFHGENDETRRRFDDKKICTYLYIFFLKF